MKAVVYKDPFKVSVDEVPDPKIEQPNDVIVRITSTAICGSDLHMYEGRTAANAGIVFGHENLGIVEEVGPGVVSVRKGDRAVAPFNVACGFCFNCERGYTAFCLTVNPGTAGGALRKCHVMPPLFWTSLIPVQTREQARGNGRATGAACAG